jgi:hypothetical protein
MRFEKREMTYGELLHPAMEITDQKEADEYFEALVMHNVEMFGQTVEEATSIMKQNLGYFAGYYDNETMKRVNKLFHTKHPIFGEAITYSSEELFEMGKNLAKEKP